MSASIRLVVRALGALIPLAVNANAQSVPTKALGAPAATFPQPFSHVAGLREQSDGRVVVLDDIEARIVRVDLREGTLTSLGRAGRGPGEYTLPIALVALGADTTLAVDMSGGGRGLVVTRDGVAAAALRSAGFAVGARLFSSSELQSDARGRLYELVPRVRLENGIPMRTTLSGVRRLDRATGRLDTLGELSRLVRSPLLSPPRPTADGGPAEVSRASAGAPKPYSSVDQWAVAPDGRIALVTVEPYRVRFVLADGRQVEGPPLSHALAPLTAADKEHWRQQRQRPVPTLTYGPNGMSAGLSRPRYEEPDAWPPSMPPFLPNAIRFAPDGVLWIQRASSASESQTFDLIDRNAQLASRVVLPPRTRLVGLGARSVYVVRIDDDDLEYLQRHPVP